MSDPDSPAGIRKGKKTKHQLLRKSSALVGSLAGIDQVTMEHLCTDVWRQVRSQLRTSDEAVDDSEEGGGPSKEQVMKYIQQVWHCVGKHIQQEVMQGRAVAVGSIGTAYASGTALSNPLKVGMLGGRAEEKEINFLFNDQFLAQYGLSQNSAQATQLEIQKKSRDLFAESQIKAAADGAPAKAFEDLTQQEQRMWIERARVVVAEAKGGAPVPGATTKLKSAAIANMLMCPKSEVEVVLSAILPRIGEAMHVKEVVCLEIPNVGELRSEFRSIEWVPTPSLESRDQTQKKSKKITVRQALGMKSRSQSQTNLMTQSMTNLAAPMPPPTPPPGTPPPGSMSPISQQQTLMKSSSSPALRSGSQTPLAEAPHMAGPLRPMAGRRSPLGEAAGRSDMMHLMRSLPTLQSLYPPILDACSRTRSAPFREDICRDAVSNVIGANYSPTGAAIVIDNHSTDQTSALRWKTDRAKLHANNNDSGLTKDERAIDWQGKWFQLTFPGVERKGEMIPEDSPVFEELEEAGLSRHEFCRMLCRYAYFTTQGISADALAPYNRRWIEHGEHLLDLPDRRRWADLDQQQQDEAMETSRREVLRDYIAAMKKSVVDYALLDARTRTRVSVSFVANPTPEWGRLPFTVSEIGTFGGPPDEWRAGLSISREDLLQCCVQNSRSAQRLKEFWEIKHANLRLMTIPPADAELVDIDRFHLQQVTHRDESRKMLTEEWNTVVNIVSEEPVYIGMADSIDAHLEPKWFDSIAALLSLMTRSTVEQTLEEYLGFFGRFSKERPLHYEEVFKLSDSDQWEDCFLVNRLIANAKGGEIKFKSGLEHCQERLLRAFKECVTCLKDFPRPDSRLKEVVSGRTMLWEIHEEEDHVVAAYRQIDDIVSMNLNNVRRVLSLYDPYVFLLGEEARVRTFTDDQSKKREDYDGYIKQLRDTEAEIRTRCPPQIRLQMMSVDCREVNEKLCQCARDCVEQILKTLATRNQDRNYRLVKQFEQMDQRIMRVPSTEAQLTEMEAEVDAARMTELPRLLEEYEDIKAWLALTWDLEHCLKEPDYKAMHSSSKWKNYINRIADREEDLKLERGKIETKFVERRTKFQDDLILYNQSVAKFKDLGSIRMVDDYLERIDALKEKFERAKEDVIDINTKEEMLGWDPTEFEALQEGIEKLEPYEKLWNLVAEHGKTSQKWMKGPLFVPMLNAEQVDADVSTMWRTAFKLQAGFQQDGFVLPANVATKVKNELDSFKEHIPVLHALCNPGFRPRHWQEISDIVGFQMEPDSSFTLKSVLEMDVGQFVSELGEISESASKEYQIEKGLEAQINEWNPVLCEFKPWRDTGTCILGGTTVDEVQTLLDDHVIKTQTMKGSPYAKAFAQQLEDWENFLKGVQDIIDVWLKVQAVWLYLEPIFSSEDIMKQMPVEGALFREVDSTWKQLIESCLADPKAMAVFKQDNFLGRLQECHDKLERVQKGLNDYLETKRLYFPRFFFLSNDNLLEILSETKDPSRVNAHMGKAFEGIRSLQFEDDLKITAMKSGEKESVPLDTIVDPVAARGAVEKWLVEIEAEMMATIRAVCMKGKDDYVDKSFVDWVQCWPGQVVIGVFNLYWTADVTNYLDTQGNEGMNVYFKVLEQYLAGIVGLVRVDIPALTRFTLEALIVIFVHNKDTVLELYQMGTCLSTDFDWLVQLRYFVEENEEKPGQDDWFVRITNSHLGYNYEYLGNSSRLVVTPLTDRCYRTCCGALHLLYGAAPEGPAGTGKTETVKDLAKALARMCVVFNCSDELDFVAMGKFFKGLAASGGWACFDEFNRIDAEVLSVIAQQILCIQSAIRNRLLEFEFEGTLLPCRWTANCFITMNPGYAGRADLPDNLKALFRTVAMMVPDYALIAEIKLYAYGYEDSRSLAGKIVTTYKLCSEQLSSQGHYDYGMRAVFSVLVAAGNQKRKYPNESEHVLMLRSICDVNLAKFLAFDVPLFKGITSDLFPGVIVPAPDYSSLITKLTEHLQKNFCQPHPYFMEKIIQFYECHIVRHSVMLVGMPFSGKTTALNTLQNALTDLANEGVMHPGCKVHQARLNPKSIPPSCLYGCFDDVSHEWTDGIVAVLFREFGRNATEERKWLLFDGPVDAVWIENMNTVMDENKKLCLNSGEIIAMSPNMRTIMEPMDVDVASPATISRNGMVFFEPHLMGYQHLVDQYFSGSMPPEMDESEVGEVIAMTDWLLAPSIKYVREQCQEVSPTQDQNLVQSFLRMVLTHLKDGMTGFLYKKGSGDDDTAHKNIITLVDGTVIFCIIWTLAGVTVTNSRPNFSVFFRKLLQGQMDGHPAFKKLNPQFPERGSVFDWVFDQSKATWQQWMDTVEPQTIPAGSKVQEIIVQTMDNVRYRYVLEHCVKHRMMLLFCGPTGTGKTAYMMQSLYALPKENYMQIIIGFSAQSKCAQTQDLIDAKLDRRRKGVYGPAMGKCGVIMVDDLNMPNKETFGAQPPIEILRQSVDRVAYPPSGGWFDRKDSTHPFMNLTDLLLFAAMGPPGGGRTFVTPRMLGHFYLVGFPLLDDDNMSKIFQTVLDWKFQDAGYPGDVQALTKKIVVGTLEMYKAAAAELLPTPLKVHYTFNLRDFAKVIFGILLMPKDQCEGTNRHIRLWIHEVWRVFGDRLTTNDDRMWMLTNTRNCCKQTFGVAFDEVMKHLDLDGDNKVQTLDEARNLFFCDLMGAPAAPKRPYQECMEFAVVQKEVESHLEQYNMMSTKKMDLVCFLYMLEHLSRVARVIKTPGGNALLVGVGGSGRQSCTKLASFLADVNVFQIEIAKGYDKLAFRDDLKTLLTKCGAKNEETIFLFTDSQIKDEAFVEDINNLLNAGEVPNLFAAEDKVQLNEMVRPLARNAGKAPDGTPAQLYAYFVELCKLNLGVVLCFSPIGDAWRARLRQFPSLVNCCTIDWFTEWPPDALASVAQRFLADVEMEDATRQSCVYMCSVFHDESSKMGIRFREQLKRIYYATPTSFLELIQTFLVILGAKRKDVSDLKSKYDVGIEKLLTTESSVEGMKKELIALQPKLVQKNKEVGEAMVVVQGESEKTAVIKEKVAGEEAIAAESAAKANAIKEDCEQQLSKAMPALNGAIAALNTLTSKDITEIKAMKDPPGPVKLVLSAVCILKNIKPARVKDESGKMVEDYWPMAVKMVSESNFLDSLKAYDKDNIPPPIVKKIATFTPLEDFQPERVEKVSKAAFGICQWVRAMETYDSVAKVVAPKKIQLAEAEAEYAEVEKQLNGKRADLKAVMDQLQALEDNLNGLKREQDDLAYQVDLCQKKLERAETLISGLGGEKTRWTANSAQLAIDYTNITGDVLVSSGVIAYLGAFTPDFREEAATEWGRISREKDIPGSETFTLEKCLGQAVLIRSWTIAGLPNDAFSIENGIIIEKSRRWPLCIDPQGQANKWIKKMGQPMQIKICKFTDGDYLRQLEGAIAFGKPVLIENILEDTDPAIEPVLLKQTFKKGNTLMLKLGDAIIEWSKDFKLYLTTKLRNPHYLPEVAVKVTLLNFMITMVGLQDQLLNIVVAKEKPDLAEEKARLVVEGAENKKQLEETENKILHVLSSSSGNILEDESAIQILSASKVISNDIAAKQEIAEVTEKQIDEARQGYVPVAFKAAILFFVIADLANIDPMYQYSLPFFVNLFIVAIEKSDPNDDLEQRVEILNDFFRYMLYCNICRSLFEKHKLLFSFLLCVRIQLNLNEIEMSDYRFLLTGGVSMEEPPEKPADWVAERCWAELFRLNKNGEKFVGFHDKFAAEIDVWRQVYDSADPMEIIKAEATRPEMMKGCTNLHDVMVLRCIRPDRVVPAIMQYVSGVLGEKFVSPPPFDLGGSYGDSNCMAPLIFILSPGSDPFSALQKYATDKGKEVPCISLGQGQGPKAEKLMAEAMQTGEWVCLQNCHLATSWMPKLDRMLDELDPKKVNKEYRLWLTSYPSNKFPVAILQNGVKMTNEPPKGLRANMTGSYLMDPISNEEFFEKCTQPEAFKKLLFSLCFFHAVCQERRLFGPLGWNIQYEFTENDLRISVRQLQMFLDDYPDEIPLKALVYLTGECNYGGRVTDDKDRLLLMFLLKQFYCIEIVEVAGHKICPGLDQYVIPPDGNYDSYLEFISKLPLTSPPGAFGFHENSNLTKEQNETYKMMEELLLTVGASSGGGGASADDVVGEVANDVLSRVPPPWNVAKVQDKYPTMYEESMNTVLVQELNRFNKLIAVCHASLKDMQKAIKGLLLMSADLELAFNTIFDGKTPAMWLAKSYPSLKPLGSYVNDLVERLKFFQRWVDQGAPALFWFSGIFFTQAFTTGASQNYARKYQIPIDHLAFDFYFPDEQEPTKKPEDGVYTYGIFLEACKWDWTSWQLEESDPKVLFCQMPMIHINPAKRLELREYPHYQCPCYKISTRKGILSTTGHSTNFVMFIKVNSTIAAEHWVKRSAAMLTSLDT